MRETSETPGPPDAILLEGMQIPAALGVTAAERRMRRPVTLDLEIETDLRAAGASDRIRQTLHYRRVFEVVCDVATNQEHKLVEALGQRIADAVLGKFAARAVTVTVRKPSPIAGVLRYAGIRIRRTARAEAANAPGQSASAPGQNLRAPGQSAPASRQSESAPGQSERVAGQSESASGQSERVAGQSESASSQSERASRQSARAPGQGGDAHAAGHGKTARS